MHLDRHMLLQRIQRVWLTVVVFAALALVLPMAASAHESRDVADGRYQFVVGFLEEPAFQGEKNGLSLRITKPAGEGATPTAEGEEARTPVEGLDQTLTAEVIYGDQTMELSLAPAFRDPGHYRSFFFPMAEGDYSFHISGDIEGNAIDETFTSSPEGFDSVQAREPLEFPKDQAKVRDSVAGSVLLSGGDAGIGSGGMIGGFATGLVIGAAGLWLVQRRAIGRPVILASSRVRG